MQLIKPLDFVKTLNGSIAIVSEITSYISTEKEPVYRASIEYIYQVKEDEKNAWWDKDDLEIIHNLPRLLTMMCVHPFSSNKELNFKQY